MNKIEQINDTGMNINFCSICNEQKEKLVKIYTAIPNNISKDVSIVYKINIYMCSDCLDKASKKIK